MRIDDLAGTILEARNLTFVRAWRHWCGGRLVPTRQDMHRGLGDIRETLDSILLLELVSSEHVRFRVAGKRFSDLLGRELTGGNYRDLTSPEDWPGRWHNLSSMSATPCGGVMGVRLPLPTGRVLSFEAVTLPIAADDPGNPNLLLTNNVETGTRRFLGDDEHTQQVPPMRDFRFVDIGAGVPKD